MSGERIILDPSEVATGRTQLDLSDWIRSDGVDWGDGEIEAYRSQGMYGEQVIDYRVPNRQVALPLMIQPRGGTAFATIRESIQAKAALFQREGGWLKRVTVTGGTFYADVQVSGLKLSGGWMQSHRDADTEAELRLECSPDFYGDELTLPDHPETSAAELTFTETGIKGTYPARVRVVVDEDQGQSQLGLMWCFRSRNYSSSATARLAYEAEALQPLDTAVKAPLSGASGGTVVTHSALATNWTPVLNLNLGGTAYLTHAGSYRLFCRYRTTSGTAVSLRSVYDVGDLVLPEENDPWYHPVDTAGTAFYIADLGPLRLQQGPVGTHRWAGQIQGRGLLGSENVSLDKVWLQATDESAGLLRAPLRPDVGLVSYSARDEFNQAAGALATKTLSVGGTWTASSASQADFQVDATNGIVTRTSAAADTSTMTGGDRIGRIDTASTPTLAGVAAFADLMLDADPGSAFVNQGVVVRYVDNNNFAVGNVQWFVNTPALASVSVKVYVAGVLTALFRVYVQVPTAVWHRLAIRVDTTGRLLLWLYPPATTSPGAPLVAGTHSALATGGALASGKVGLRDECGAIITTLRKFDNFAVFDPATDALLHASQSAELRTDGMFREDVSGSAYGPVSWVEGDLPRLPVSGLESRTVEMMLKMSRGNFADLPDTGIDDVSARAFYRPCWLTVPGT